jgi:hypothetical protein
MELQCMLTRTSAYQSGGDKSSKMSGRLTRNCKSNKSNGEADRNDRPTHGEPVRQVRDQKCDYIGTSIRGNGE